MDEVTPENFPFWLAMVVVAIVFLILNERQPR